MDNEKNTLFKNRVEPEFLLLKLEIKSNSTEYSGTKIFIGKPVKNLVKDKTKRFDIESNKYHETGTPMKETKNEELRMDLSNKEWYVYNENYGTTQEKYFVKFLNNMMDKLSKKYEEVYLIRNEKLFQIYNFSDGKAFEPDFILFLKKNNNSKPVQYQLFVEPKGEGFIPKDQWKEELLEKIKKESKIQVLSENKKYRILGLPFYHEKIKKEEFKERFEEELLT